MAVDDLAPSCFCTQMSTIFNIIILINPKSRRFAFMRDAVIMERNKKCVGDLTLHLLTISVGGRQDES